jgi:hypothetical protein
MTAAAAALAEELIALETEALRRWCDGDPSGYLTISAPEVTYFEPFLQRRLDGLPALTAHYEALRGKIRADRFELIAPKVTPVGDVGAVLTFDFVSWGGGGSMAWHCSEVYARTAAGWRIVQTHWSLPTASAA